MRQSVALIARIGRSRKFGRLGSHLRNARKGAGGSGRFGFARSQHKRPFKVHGFEAAVLLDLGAARLWNAVQPQAVLVQVYLV